MDRKEAARLRWMDPEYRKKNHGNQTKGAIPWNKGLTKDVDIRVRKYAETKKGKSMPNNVREKIRQKLLGNKLPKNHPFLKKGRIPWNKGTKNIQQSHRKGISMDKEYGIERAKLMKENITKKLTGIISPKRGTTLSLDVRKRISTAVKNSEKYKRGIAEYYKHPKQVSSQELKLREELEKKNIHYESQKALRGVPDIFIAPNICIFCDGDYWHGNEEYFEKYNRVLSKKHINARYKDYAITRYLENKGYLVLRFWETDINKRIDWCISRIIKVLNVLRR